MPDKNTQAQTADNQAPAPAQPQALTLDPAAIAQLVAQSMQAAQRAVLTPATATPGIDQTVKGGFYYERGMVLDANGNQIADAPSEHKRAARNAFLPPGRRVAVGPDEGDADEGDTPVSDLTQGAATKEG